MYLYNCIPFLKNKKNKNANYIIIIIIIIRTIDSISVNYHRDLLVCRLFANLFDW